MGPLSWAGNPPEGISLTLVPSPVLAEGTGALGVLGEVLGTQGLAVTMTLQSHGRWLCPVTPVTLPAHTESQLCCHTQGTQPCSGLPRCSAHRLITLIRTN